MSPREGLLSLVNDRGRLTSAMLSITTDPPFIRAFVHVGEEHWTLAATDHPAVLEFFAAILTETPTRPE